MTERSESLIPNLTWTDLFEQTKNTAIFLWKANGLATQFKMVFFGTSFLFTLGYGGLSIGYLYKKQFRKYNIAKKVFAGVLFASSMPVFYTATSKKIVLFPNF
jgi:hypothetical protein